MKINAPEQCFGIRLRILLFTVIDTGKKPLIIIKTGKLYCKRERCMTYAKLIHRIAHSPEGIFFQTGAHSDDPMQMCCC